MLNNPVLKIPAYAEPMTVTEAKLHLKVESSVTDDDELITALIIAAREAAEAEVSIFRNRSSFTAMVQTWTFYLDAFPFDCIYLPRDPLVAIDSITYQDVNGTVQTLATSVYTINIPANRIDLAYGESWPTTYDVPNAVTIQFKAGLMATFTEDLPNDEIDVQGRSFTEDDLVRLMNSGGALCSELSLKTDYYVLSTGSSFGLSLTEGGSAVTLTNAGTGTFYIGVDLARFESLRQAMLLLLGHWYENREAVTMTGGVPKTVPYGFERACAAAA